MTHFKGFTRSIALGAMFATSKIPTYYIRQMQRHADFERTLIEIQIISEANSSQMERLRTILVWELNNTYNAAPGEWAKQSVLEGKSIDDVISLAEISAKLAGL